MPAKSSDTVSWVVGTSITAAFAYGAYKAKPTWAKVLLGVGAAIGIPAAVGGPALRAEIRAKREARAATQSKRVAIPYEAPGTYSKPGEVPDWMTTPPTKGIAGLGFVGASSIAGGVL